MNSSRHPSESSFLDENKLELLSYLLDEEGIEEDASPDTIQPRQQHERLPLSFAQQRLWFLHQLESQRSAYNLFSAKRIRGNFNIQAFQASLNEILRRHEVLRTSFPAKDGQPQQQIAASVQVPLAIVDLQAMLPVKQQKAIEDWAREQAQYPFDLSQAPLLRVTLLQLDRTKWVALFVMHHIVSDGWSVDILIRELASLYGAFSQGSPSPLPELPIQYADFAIWQRQQLQGEVFQEHLNYWKQQLGGQLPVLELPTDYTRPPVQRFRGGTQSLMLPPSLSKKLQALSQQEGTTLYMTLLAAFQTLLHRYSGQTDIVVGSPIANRNRSEIENLIGFFVNTLVLRVDFSGHPTFVELLDRVRQVTLDAYAHQDLPFEKLVEALQPDRDLSYTPLFQVMFVLQNASNEELSLPGLELHSMEVPKETAQFDLTCFVEQMEAGLQVTLAYKRDLFEAATIDRMLGHFQTLLEAIADSPNQHLGDLPLLTAAERHQLLLAFNDTHVERPHHLCIHQLVEEQVERTPEATAVVFEKQGLTYRELNRRANQLGHYLQARGIGPEVGVGICMERSLEMVVGLLGILKAGGAYVPLDPNYPKQRLAFVLSDAQVPLVLTQQHLQSLLPQHPGETVCLDADWEAIADQRTDNPVCNIKPENLAYILYTSGSTGTPKGVMNPHVGVCNRLLWMQEAYGLTATDRVLQKTPYSFDVSVWEFFWTLSTGACLVVARPEGHKDPAYLAELLVSEDISTVHFVPSMLRTFLEATPMQEYPALKRVICSGEVLPPDLQQHFFQRFAAQLYNLYGPTEASIDVTAWTCRWQDNEQTVPIGKPITNLQVYILDNRLQLVPIGVPGELCIGGMGLARGYCNRPEQTAERFVPHPYSETPGARLYKTGDLACYRSDGAIEFLGRIDHQVKLRGFRIELGEIEEALRQHPAVRESAVLLDKERSHTEQLIAYIATPPKQDVASRELHRFLKDRLPEYMVPSAFVPMETLPKTPNGKIDRQALPAPQPADGDQNRSEQGPRNPVEEIVTGIWMDVLACGSINPHNNFFELGGHSLLATQVMSRLNRAFGTDLPLRSLFEFPTVAGLADRVNAATHGTSGEAEPISRISRHKPLPLSFAQERLWFVEQLSPQSSAYNISTAIHMRGHLDVEALHRSLNEIVRRHEVLRTNIQTVSGHPVAEAKSTLNLSMPIVDLQSFSQSDREAEVQRLAAREGQRPFHIESEPVLRTCLLHLDATEYVLLFSIHHIACDGWSLGVLVRELAELYQAFRAGKPSPLPELSIQYADFAAWQRCRLSGDFLDAQLAYWREQIQGVPRTLSLPYKTSPPAASDRGTTHSFTISSDLQRSLYQQSCQEGVTLFMSLLAAFETLLYRHSGQENFLVGTDLANRDRPETEDLIGCFVNVLPLRANLSGYPTFRHLLQRVRQVTLGAYAHQQVPFEKLVEELQPERSNQGTPLIQVLFVMQNTPMPAFELPGLQVTPRSVSNNTAKFDLALFVTETPKGISATWRYKTDLFDTEIIERWSERFQGLLENALNQPDTRIDELSLLGTAQREQQKQEETQRERRKFQKFQKFRSPS